MLEKTCSKCNETKPVTEFHRRTGSKDGLVNRCKSCASEHGKKWYCANREHDLESGRVWYELNRERRSQTIKMWGDKNKTRRSDSGKQHYQANKTQIHERMKLYRRTRRTVDFVYAALMLARRTIQGSLRRKGFTKRSKTADLLGCDWATFELHLSSKFADGMSWANRSEWHIDHVTPLATAQNIEDVERLCHYTNLQPLWAADNLRKGAKITT